MTDRLTPARRSKNMASIRSKDTKPELIVRRLLHLLGFRYRVHVDSLPGKPDIVFRKRRKIIEVRGCFWHGHDCKEGKRVPKSKIEYWKSKIAGNRLRDQTQVQTLLHDRWSLLIVWECEINDLKALTKRLHAFLEDDVS